MISFSLWLWAAESFDGTPEKGPKNRSNHDKSFFFEAPSPTSSQNQAHAGTTYGEW